MAALDISSLAKIVKDWASGEPLIRQVWIFGSYSRNEQTSESDVDVALLMVPTETDERLQCWFSNAARWRIELQSKLPVKLHLEAGDDDLSPEIVAPAILSEGVLVFIRHEN